MHIGFCCPWNILVNAYDLNLRIFPKLFRNHELFKFSEINSIWFTSAFSLDEELMYLLLVRKS